MGPSHVSLTELLVAETNWLRWKDSNLRPSGYEPDELTTALHRYKPITILVGGCRIELLPTRNGFTDRVLEPPTLSTQNIVNLVRPRGVEPLFPE